MENRQSLQTSTAPPSFTPAEFLSIASPAKDRFSPHPHPLRWSSYGLRLKKKEKGRGGGESSCFLLSHATWRTKRNFLVAIGKKAYRSWVSRKRESEKTNIKRKWGNTWPKERNFRALEQALNSLYGLELEPTCRHSSVSRVSCSSKRLNAMMSRH